MIYSYLDVVQCLSMVNLYYKILGGGGGGGGVLVKSIANSNSYYFHLKPSLVLLSICIYKKSKSIFLCFLNSMYINLLKKLDIYIYM